MDNSAALTVPHYNGDLSHILSYQKKLAALRYWDIALDHAATAIIFWFIVGPYPEVSKISSVTV